MTVERPADIILTETTVDAREVDRHEIDHGTITVDPDEKTVHVEAVAELEILDDGRTRTTVLMGDAELSLTYNREDQGSAERAAVLLAGAAALITQVEEAYDNGELEDD
jgi:hypothetical protein